MLSFNLCADAQIIKELNIKAGPVISVQKSIGKTSSNSLYSNVSPIWGFSLGIEPVFYKSGSFDIGTDFSFVQKGSYNSSPVYSYDSYGHLSGTGSESYEVKINYISISPSVKYRFAKSLFIKAGPRADFFTGFKSKAADPNNQVSNSDFEPVTFGVSYGAGFCTGEKRTKFIFEFLGQQDFTESSHNKVSGLSYRNNSFLISIGANITLGKME